MYVTKQLELKEPVLQEREFVGYAATWDVDSVGDRIVPGAFTNLADFVRDGFIAVAHDWSRLPVASILDAQEDDKGLLLHARFHTHPEAEAAYQYVRERLELGKTVKLSVGFVLKRSHDEPAENGAVVRVIEEAELLEVSLVGVPANPKADVIAVKGGVETEQKATESNGEKTEPKPGETKQEKPQEAVSLADVIEHLYYKIAEALLKESDEEDWVVGGARDLDVLDDAEWDAEAAEAAVRRLAGGDPTLDDFDWALYHKAFVVYNRAKPKAITSHKLPFCKVRDGELVASRRGLIAARAALRGARGGVKLPESVRQKAEEFVDAYLKQFEDEDNG